MLQASKTSVTVLISLVIILCLATTFYKMHAIGTVSNKPEFIERVRDIAKENHHPSAHSSPTGHRKNIEEILMEYNNYSLDKLRSLLDRNVTSRDPDLISLIRDLMDPPSDHIIKNVRRIVSTPQSEEVLIILNKTVSFFCLKISIEAFWFLLERSKLVGFVIYNLSY